MMILKQKQTGFTLVEIAIVLVIIGLLLGGILKGQELINSARVRALADTNSGIQAAYFGFVDRYRQVPGDFPNDAGQATNAIGVAIGIGGNANGRIDNTIAEAAAVWEHLSKAGFIQGSYNPDADAAPADEATYATPGANWAPQNPFNGFLTLTRNDNYTTPAGGTPSQRLNLHLGQLIPVNIARELDVKVDDSRPQTGVVRLTGNPTAPFATLHSAEANCVDGVEYNITDDEQDCGVTFLY